MVFYGVTVARWETIENVLVVTLSLATYAVAPLPQQSSRDSREMSAAVVERLLEQAGDRSVPAEQRQAIWSRLAEAEGPLPFDSLAVLKSDVRSSWLPDYVRCLGRTSIEAVPLLEKYLSSRADFVRAEAVYAVAQLGGSGGVDLALGILRNTKEENMVRVAALRGLSAAGSPFARVEAARRLKTAEGTLLLEAVATMAKRPSQGDIPYLIQLVERKPNSRAAGEAVLILQKLTGYRIGRDARTWTYWMRRYKAERKPFWRETGEGAVDSETLSYLGIPILGDRVAFVLDSSGSMATPMQEQTKKTRGEFAVNALNDILPRLPNTALFSLTFFEANVHSLSSVMVPRVTQELRSAALWLKMRQFAGGTNLFGGLDRALEFEGVEEIILLSDGAPSAGDWRTPNQILSRIRRLNRWRRVRISAIGIGVGSSERTFLSQLARENQGDIQLHH